MGRTAGDRGRGKGGRGADEGKIETCKGRERQGEEPGERGIGEGEDRWGARGRGDRGG